MEQFSKTLKPKKLLKMQNKSAKLYPQLPKHINQVKIMFVLKKSIESAEQWNGDGCGIEITVRKAKIQINQVLGQ
jgi:hypothetical protein